MPQASDFAVGCRGSGSGRQQGLGIAPAHGYGGSGAPRDAGIHWH